MKEYFTELFDYNYSSNNKIIDILNNKDVVKVRELFSHTLNAHAIWLSRINKTIAPFGPFDLLQTGNLSKVNEQNHFDTLEIIANEDINSMLTYKNLQGGEFTNSIQEIFTHIINHSSYHRGQIATIFRVNEVEPPSTDYISYSRIKRGKIN